jgi:hypothetical protein
MLYRLIAMRMLMTNAAIEGIGKPPKDRGWFVISDGETAARVEGL